MGCAGCPLGPTIARAETAIWHFHMAKMRTRIAVVDDDASVRNALCRLLRAFDFETKAYGRGADFLAAYPYFKPHCAIVDLHMPGMSGLEAQEHLKSNGSDISVIIITGHDAPHSRAECLSAGASAYLTKPIDEEILMSSIRAIVAVNAGGKPPKGARQTRLESL
jgi:FixJ family two-component response regulator